MKTSENINEIAEALANFHMNVKQPKKDGTNPHFKSSYVTLDGVVNAINECAPKFGLSYIQVPKMTDVGIAIATTILHKSGQFIEFDDLPMPVDKKTAQGIGSAISYGRRYSLSAAFGISSDVDDDGNGASPAPQQSGYNNGYKKQAAPPKPTSQASNPNAITAQQQQTIKEKAAQIAALKSETPQAVFGRYQISANITKELADVKIKEMQAEIAGVHDTQATATFA